MLFFWTFYSSKILKKIPQNIKQWKPFFSIDNNNTCFLSTNQHISLISEGSCDTEDWSNDAENTALTTGRNYILTPIQI